MVDYHPLKRLAGTRREYERQVVTICQECTVGCGLVAFIDENRIVDVQGNESDPVSRGRLCTKGTTFCRDVHNPDRIFRPAVRSQLPDEFTELEDWEQALDLLSERLKRVRDQHGPGSLLIACDPGAGLDFTYAGMRFAALWDTPYLIEPFRQTRDAPPTGLYPGPGCRCSDMAGSRCVFCIGADPAATHPVAANWILDAQQRGAAVVVADTRFTATMSKADLALPIRPESGNLLGMALMKVILDNELHCAHAVETMFADARAWKDSFDRMSLPDAAESTGLPVEQLRELASLLASRGPVHVITGRSLGRLPGHGIWRTLAAAMGWSGKPGAGWYPLDSGRPPLDVTADLDGIDPLSPLPAVDPSSLLQKLLEKSPKDGEHPIKAFISSGNCFDHLVYATGQSLGPIELAATFSPSPDRSRSFSHFLFPASLWAERDGLFFTNDRSIRWALQILEPGDGARSGLDFWIGLARRFGWEAHFPWVTDEGRADHRAFAEWLLALNPLTKACIPAVWEHGGEVYWARDSPGREAWEPTPAPASRATLPAQEGEIDPFPLHLDSPDIGARASEPADLWPWTGEWEKSLLLQIHPEIAAVLCIETGDAIVGATPDWHVEARAWVSRAVPRDVVYSTRTLGATRVLVHRKGQTGEEALCALKGLFQ